MTSLKFLPCTDADQAGPVWFHPARRVAASSLQAASAALAKLAAQLALPLPSASKRPPVLEFYAEAGAPEGALYLDGEFVGWLPGVTRL